MLHRRYYLNLFSFWHPPLGVCGAGWLTHRSAASVKWNFTGRAEGGKLTLPQPMREWHASRKVNERVYDSSSGLNKLLGALSVQWVIVCFCRMNVNNLTTCHAEVQSGMNACQSGSKRVKNVMNYCHCQIWLLLCRTHWYKSAAPQSDVSPPVVYSTITLWTLKFLRQVCGVVESDTFQESRKELPTRKSSLVISI